MTDFTSRRVEKRYVFSVDVPPDKVFPLLCPIREYEWIDGWECDMVYSESGVAEQDCVFKTDLPGRGEATWMISRHDRDNLMIEFVVFHTDLVVEKLTIALEATEAGGSVSRWTRVYTGLSEQGNEFIAEITGDALDTRMEQLFQSLHYYLRTGQMLARGRAGQS